MTPHMMRQLWAVIESIQVSTLLQVDDSTLIQMLLKQFESGQPIDAHTTNSLNSYIKAKLPLIRDTAESRKAVQSGNY